MQVQEPEEEDAKYLARQQVAVDEINKRGLVLFHATVQASSIVRICLLLSQCVIVQYALYDGLPAAIQHSGPPSLSGCQRKARSC